MGEPIQNMNDWKKFQIKQAGIKCGKERCKFNKSHYVHIITKERVQPNNERAWVILELSNPICVSQLRYVVMIWYLGRFLPNIADAIKLMSDFIKNKKRNSLELKWTAETSIFGDKTAIN